MLYVRTYVAASAIHGLGLFAAEDIREGQLVWRFKEGFDQTFTPEFVETLSGPAKEFMDNHAYMIDGEVHLTTDNDKFTNHSDDPNTVALDDGRVLATRDIKKGEEITNNYDQFDNWTNKKLGRAG